MATSAAGAKAKVALITAVGIHAHDGKKILERAAMGPNPSGFAAFRADPPMPVSGFGWAVLFRLFLVFNTPLLPEAR